NYKTDGNAQFSILLIVYLFVCVLNFADKRQKFESDFQKSKPAWRRASAGTFVRCLRRVEATLGRSISRQPFR
ncbi:MAG: hypothetical protein WCS31_14125, partial [Verrucomicrobiae bacterium]